MTDKTASTSDTSKDQVTAFPEKVWREMQAHTDLYLKDPEKAHYWDPIVVGVGGGPISCLLIEHRGRKSGKVFHAVVQYFDFDGKIVVVGSRGGNVKHADWYQNVVANPQCDVRIGKLRCRAVARTAQGEERADLWDRISRVQPLQPQYQALTSRLIPVVVLELSKQSA